jgi:hypothetical protein
MDIDMQRRRRGHHSGVRGKMELDSEWSIYEWRIRLLHDLCQPESLGKRDRNSTLQRQRHHSLAVRTCKELLFIRLYDEVVLFRSFDKLESKLHWQRLRHTSPNNWNLQPKLLTSDHIRTLRLTSGS